MEQTLECSGCGIWVIMKSQSERVVDMNDQASYLVVDDFGDYHSFQTLKEAGRFAEMVMRSTEEEEVAIFAVKEVACVSREVSFSLHIY